jgi:hypothetical protein
MLQSQNLLHFFDEVRLGREAQLGEMMDFGGSSSIDGTIDDSTGSVANNIWSSVVEEAFQEALVIYPTSSTGRQKIKGTNGRLYGAF